MMLKTIHTLSKVSKRIFGRGSTVPGRTTAFASNSRAAQYFYQSHFRPLAQSKTVGTPGNSTPIPEWPRKRIEELEIITAEFGAYV